MLFFRALEPRELVSPMLRKSTSGLKGGLSSCSVEEGGCSGKRWAVHTTKPEFNSCFVIFQQCELRKNIQPPRFLYS